MKNEKVDHNNIFESYLARDIFIMDIIEKVIADWKRTKRKEGTFTRENLEDFFFDEFQNWFESGVQEWCDAEFGLEE
jgi:hypothetical protein